MTTVGFIGLGLMGKPMARNLHDAGYRVVVHSRSAGPVEELARHGLGTAGSAAEVGTGCDVVITCLPDTPDVEQVVLGDAGVLTAMAGGGLVIDMSTVEPALARRISGRAAERGIGALDAPVSGGREGAEKGTLSIMVGGTDVDVERGRPLFDVLGSTVVHTGPAGSGQTVKAANQMIAGGAMAVLGEALAMLEAGGADLEAAVRALSGGLAGSTILDTRAQRMIGRRFEPTFRAELHLKDLRIALATARASGVVTPVTALVEQLYAALCAQGDGGLDTIAVTRLPRQLSGSHEDRTD